MEITKISCEVTLEAEVLYAISNVDTIKKVQSFIQKKDLEVYDLLVTLEKSAEKLSLGIYDQVYCITFFAIFQIKLIQLFFRCLMLTVK